MVGTGVDREHISMERGLTFAMGSAGLWLLELLIFCSDKLEIQAFISPSQTFTSTNNSNISESQRGLVVKS